MTSYYAVQNDNTVIYIIVGIPDIVDTKRNTAPSKLVAAMLARLLITSATALYSRCFASYNLTVLSIRIDFTTYPDDLKSPRERRSEIFIIADIDCLISDLIAKDQPLLSSTSLSYRWYPRLPFFAARRGSCEALSLACS